MAHPHSTPCQPHLTHPGAWSTRLQYHTGTAFHSAPRPRQRPPQHQTPQGVLYMAIDLINQKSGHLLDWGIISLRQRFRIGLRQIMAEILTRDIFHRHCCKASFKAVMTIRRPAPRGNHINDAIRHHRHRHHRHRRMSRMAVILVRRTVLFRIAHTRRITTTLIKNRRNIADRATSCMP